MKGKQSSSGMKVRDMVRRYDTALNSDSIKPSYSSFGLNAQNIPDEDLYEDDKRHTSVFQESLGSPSRSSSGSPETVRNSISPRYENLRRIPTIPLDTQKSFLNLSRSREPAREPRHSSCEEDKDGKKNMSDVSYQSKTTISKTPNGVRIIVDIFFDQNKGHILEDVVGSRIETDIPPSKILKEFQRRVAETSQD